ncbi:unnamed protein product, partial [Polarella glacialis]
ACLRLSLRELCVLSSVAPFLVELLDDPATTPLYLAWAYRRGCGPELRRWQYARRNRPLASCQALL